MPHSCNALQHKPLIGTLLWINASLGRGNIEDWWHGFIISKLNGWFSTSFCWTAY